MNSPSQQVFWLASRAVGIVAIALLGISVALGLLISSRIVRRPGMPARMMRWHQSATLVSLGLIGLHGGLLLFDGYLRPGLTGVTVPFVMSYRPVFSGLGIVAGWLGALLGLSFYLRKRIGTRTWRRLHRLTPFVYLFALLHVLGAGTDARRPWMIAMLTVLTAPVAGALTYRLLPAGRVAV